MKHINLLTQYNERWPPQLQTLPNIKKKKKWLHLTSKTLFLRFNQKKLKLLAWEKLCSKLGHLLKRISNKSENYYMLILYICNLFCWFRDQCDRDLFEEKTHRWHLLFAINVHREIKIRTNPKRMKKKSLLAILNHTDQLDPFHILYTVQYCKGRWGYKGGGGRFFSPSSLSFYF